MSDVRERRRGGPERTPLTSATPLDARRKSSAVPLGDDRAVDARHWFAIVAIVLLIIAGCNHLHHCVPKPLDPSPENDRFSEARARPILDRLSALGPKPSGSFACENQSVSIILDELRRIEAQTAGSAHRLEIQLQFPSSCFDIPRHDTDGFAICYRNVSNVIARLGARNRDWQQSQISVLVNCHYDSWPTSPAGSDDLASCALMLEMLRVLSDARRTPVTHDVIFLFNGAEENSLQAAHGFITQHPWRHGVRAFINLEASGSGGRELLFQAGPGHQWLLNSYLHAARHPHCSVIGQEVFQSGVYPGDTDFRVFKDYGRIPGLDLAFVQNGYWWHTEFDRAELITPGSLQRAGENVLATLTHLLDSPFLENPGSYGDRRFVFFDVVGMFTVVYPMDIAEWLNYITSAAILLRVIWNLYRFNVNSKAPRSTLKPGYSTEYLVWAFAAHGIALIATAIGVLALTRLVVALELTLTWYSKHWATLFMYGVPLTVIALVVHLLFAMGLSRKKPRDISSSSMMESAIFDTHLLLNIIPLLFLTYQGYASSYIFFILAIFPLLRDVILYLLELILKRKAGNDLFVFVHLLYCLPGLLMIIYSVQLLLSVFIPIMGRNSSNPELVIAGFLAVGATYVAGAMASLVYRSRGGLGKLLIIATAITMAFYLLLAMTSFGAAYRYTPEYPNARRTQFFHMRRRMHGVDGSLTSSDNGIVAIAHDFRGADDIPFVGAKNSGFRPIRCETSSRFCEIPYYFPVANRVNERLLRFKPVDEQLNLKHPVELSLKAKSVQQNEITYSFRVTGSDHISLYITPQEPFLLANWSFTHKSEVELDRSSFIFLSCVGDGCGKWDFTLTLQDPDGSIVPSNSRPLLIAAVAHYIHGEEMHSQALRNMLDEIARKRRDPGNWRWAMTASAWNADLVSYYF